MEEIEKDLTKTGLIDIGNLGFWMAQKKDILAIKVKSGHDPMLSK